MESKNAIVCNLDGVKVLKFSSVTVKFEIIGTKELRGMPAG